MAGHREHESTNGTMQAPPWEELNLGGRPIVATSTPGSIPVNIGSTPDAWQPQPRTPGLGQRVFGSLGGWFSASANQVALPAEEETATSPVEVFISSTPPWLVSMIVHFLF